MQNNDKTLSTSFNKKEFLQYLENICDNIEKYGPDVIKVHPDFYNQMEALSKKLQVYNSGLGLPIYSYYGVPLEIDNKLTKPYKIIRGGKEI